ncbi:MAG: ATP-dependent DNA helicase [Candidatus Nanopelagicales bacterium]
MTLLDEALDAVVADLGGERREGQRRMAQAVLQAMETREHLLVQAGTGTGKSVAYLVPAILRALQRQETVVVSTATLALQRQLVGRDLPRIVKALAPLLGRTATFAVAKGRHNYVCKARLNADFAAAEDDAAALFAAPTTKLGREAKRVRTWAFLTETGDREDLEPAPDQRVWRALSVSGNECIGAAKCPYGDECFTEKVRTEAAGADIVVTNHAMLVIHALTGHPLLPEHAVVIVDEGHDLADTVTNQATEVLTAGMVERAATRGRRLIDTDIVGLLEDAADGLSLLFNEIAKPWPQRIARDVEHEQLLAQSVLVPALTAVRDAANNALVALAAAAKGDGDAPADVQAERLAARVAVTEVNDVAGRLLALKDQDVAWLDRAEGRAPSISVAPLTVSGLLAETLFGDKTVIVTSATLSLGGDFEAIARSLGLRAEPRAFNPDAFHEDPDEEPDAQTPDTMGWTSLDVGTPFDPAKQGMLYVASQLPAPGRDGTSADQLDELRQLIEASGGRALALFSSWRAVDAAEALLEPVCQAMRVELLVQRRGAVVSDLVKRFAADETSVLLGTLSLWQGVDVPGESCSLVIIDRIPFPRPDDPLHAARQARVDAAGGSGFMSVAVPRAALLLAQGAGRLIRSQRDRGVVAVLDSRLATARYGSYLRRSMPPFYATTDRDVVMNSLRRLAESRLATPN